MPLVAVALVSSRIMLEPVSASPMAKLLARALATLHPVGAKGVSLTPAALREVARRDAGLDDFGDSDFEEPFEILCQSLREEAELSTVGRLFMGGHVINALSTRLQRVELRRRRPELFAAPLVPPLLVVGLPRSGTTFLHRLLSLDEAARPLKLYEIQRPIRQPGFDGRRLLSEGMVRVLKLVAPSIDAKHHVGADEPEECMFLFDSSLLSFTFWALAPVYSYAAYYGREDKSRSYETYREHLQIFQAEQPTRRLTLKAPAHTGHLTALFEVIPEVLVVQCHRDPVRSVSSVNSLFHTFHSVMSDRPDIRRTAALNLQLLAGLAKGNVAARARLGDRVHDVHYGDLVGNPVETVRRIHSHFGLHFSSSFERRLAEYVAARPKGKHGKHEYAAEEFGQTDAAIAGRFADYRARFL